MKLINADYLTGRIFTEADLTNAHTCYDSIMAIIESMESEDVLDKIRAEIEELDGKYVIGDYATYGEHSPKYVQVMEVLQVIDKYRNEVNE